MIWLETIVCFIALAETYQLAVFFLPYPWVAAALVNSILAVILLWFVGKSSPQATQPPAGSRERVLLSNAWLILLVVVFLLTCLPLVSTLKGADVQWKQWLWVLWPPLVEEMVFRKYLFSRLARAMGLFGGMWLSSLVFSALHGLPSFEDVLNLDLGLPLGPFLLGLCCSWIFYRTGKISHAIGFHCACNLTPLIFQKFGPQWLDIFGFLYLKMT